MAQRRIGIIMNGVTGRMGMNQHLIRSIAAIRADGGLPLANGDILMPDPIIVGRNRAKLEALARAHNVERVSTDLDACLADPKDEIFFDAATTQMRAGLVRKAIAAGKHVYCEKPTADNLADALDLARVAKAAGIKHGVVQDKLFLPGLRKLKMVIDSGQLGRLLSVRGEFGYWVFEGDLQPTQRPSWNYKKAEGGGIILDMLCHWRYVLDNTFGAVKSLSCLGAIHIPKRKDEAGNWYDADVDDAAYATFQLEGAKGEPIVAHINSSWATRVRRDDLVTFHVDGTHGSAVCGLTDCWVQPRVATPKPVWNPDVPQTINFYEGWQKVPDTQPYPNGFRVQWELFLRHVVGEVKDYPWDLLAGAKGVQMAMAGLQSWEERRWIDLPKLEV
jgi:predicted dehydrogenase